MSDNFTETTSTSWFTRLSRSFGGIFIGLLLVLVSLVGLFINEGRAVKTARALAEGAGIVTSIDASAIDPARDGRLVHVSGAISPIGTPADPEFSISVPGALRLERQVEMYQWKETSSSETRNKVGGGTETVTTYRYEKTWSPSRIDSGAFRQPAGHENPNMAIAGSQHLADGAELGAFRLTQSQISSLGETRPVQPDAKSRTRLAAATGKLAAAQSGDALYSGDPANPGIGDLRVSWKAAFASEISIVGKQTGNGLTAYKTSNGRELLMIRNGNVGADTMFEDAQAGNATLTWVLRVAGLVALFAGFSMMLSILGVIGDVIPLIGRLVRSGTGLVAMFLTAILGPLAIALGWVAYRPLVALAILAIGLAIAWIVTRMARNRQPLDAAVKA
ncbi:MAG: TMEM43 family protein [Nitratireductor sp.]|nr:TMEM43 family protein [Nitratireductor sp.]MCB1455420.1 TMEM43 family protein [Nitratireductor sp.]